MKPKRIFLSVILLSFFSGCDGPYKNCPDHYFSGEFKAYTTFNPGSYWIYSDTTLGLTDSICLITQDMKYKEDCDYHGDPQELLSQSFYSSFFAPHSFYMDCQAENPVYYRNDLFGYFNDGLKIGERMEFTYEAKLDSLMIDNTIYKEVMVFSQDDLHKYYWAKGIGLVKKVFPDTGNGDTIFNFELVRQHVSRQP